CPTSNYRTGVVPSDEVHPIGAMLGAQLPVIIDADDPTLFGTTISHEYALVANAFGPQVLHACIERAISASFADASEQQRLRAALHEARTATNPLSEAL
ncbi:MAG: adenosine deaminase, partial [Vulcanimicrobiaceae bacterium]